MKRIISLLLACILFASPIVEQKATAAATPKLSLKSVKIQTGSQKKVNVKNAKKYKLSWKSGNKKIATVKKSGKTGAQIKGISAGQTKITCTCKKGKKSKKLNCKVKVVSATDTKPQASAQAPVPSASALAPAVPSASAAPSASAPGETKAPVTAKPVYTFKPDFNYTLKSAYGKEIPKIGTCLSYNSFSKQLDNEETMNFVKEQYTSFTMENEMKPEFFFKRPEGHFWGDFQISTISIEEAKKRGYYIPDGYTDTEVPELDFTYADKVLETANKHGLAIRAHTLLWHKQTPAQFFYKDIKKVYQDNETIEFTTPENMDLRLEFYVRTVMNYLMDKEKELTGANGTIIYAWDVVNEYIHRFDDSTLKSTWVNVYGDMKLQPSYVKKAFEFAYSELEKYGVTDKVTLFYNDYNTYQRPEDTIKLIEFINSGEKANICGGMGMQSHLDVKKPSVGKYIEAMQLYMKTGLEIQMTELDITINYDNASGMTDDDQAVYVKNLMTEVLKLHLNRDKSKQKGITGITLWGLYDSVSWRRQNSPLLFKSLTSPKPSYYSFIEAAIEAGIA